MSGKVCVITGASKGVGRGVAKVLSSKGMYCVLVARSENLLKSLLEEIQAEGGKGMTATCDVSNRESVQAMAKMIMEEVGVPDFLINNAGAWAFQEFTDNDHDSWDFMIDVNIKGNLNMISSFLPAMKAKNAGHIINVTSDSEKTPCAGVSVYTGTKFFMSGFVQSLRMELKGTNIRITNILPGFIWTDGLEQTLNNPAERAALVKFGLGDPDEMIKNKDLMLRPEDLANCVHQVVSSPANHFIMEVQLKDRMQDL